MMTSLKSEVAIGVGKCLTAMGNALVVPIYRVFGMVQLRSLSVHRLSLLPFHPHTINTQLQLLEELGIILTPTTPRGSSLVSKWVELPDVVIGLTVTINCPV
jgi:hypothetical protein